MELWPVVYNTHTLEADTIEYHYTSYKKLYTYSIRDFYRDNGTLYIPTNQGVFYHDPYSYHFKEVYPMKSNFQFRNLGYPYLFEKENMLLLSYSRRIRMYDLEADSVSWITTIDNGLHPNKDNQINTIFPLNDDEVLIFSNEVYRLSNRQKSQSLVFSREYLDMLCTQGQAELRYPYVLFENYSGEKVLFYYRDGSLIPIDIQSLTVLEDQIIS
jgi:hypothetical protein